MLATFRVALALSFLCAVSADAQVTSIFLSYSQWQTEGSREVAFELVTPYHEGVRTIEYQVRGDTAKAGLDFIASAGTFVFQPNEFVKRFTVQLLDDQQFEGNEIFWIELSNPVPEQPFRAINYVFIRDDEEGYAPAFGQSAMENAGHIDIPIYRKGDIDFASSVEVYLEEGTAKPGVDYVEENYTVEFGPNESAKTVRVPLINNTVEDPHTSVFLDRGDRFFYVGLSNSIGGVPIALPDRAEVIIHDNELGYSIRGATGGREPTIYEGGPEPLVLQRLGDYDVASTAAVAVTSPPFHYLFPPAEAGVDYTGSEFQIEFAPGQTSAEVPLALINDALEEPREWLNFQYPTNVSVAGNIEQMVAILDNEFNPLPVTAFCLNLQPLVASVIPLRDGKFLVAGADDDSARNFTIRRFTATGEPDPSFLTIRPQDPPVKIVEGSDGRYTISFSNWRTAKQGIERYLADGRPDPSFQRFEEEYVNGFHEFEVTADGRVYLGYALRRLKSDGTLDSSFAPAGIQGLDDIVLDSAENVYVRSGTGWIRISPGGSVDPTFSESTSDDILREVGGQLYVYRYDSQLMIAKTWRILASGAPDPSFTPITNGWIYPGANGVLYAFEQSGSATHLRRHHSDGTLDASYMRGTVDVDWPVYNFSMLRDGRGFLTRNAVGAAFCPDGSPAVARVDLDIPRQRTIVEPGRAVLSESGSSGATFIPIVRTGDNSASATIRYRIVPESAVPGEHYAAPGDVAELTFAPGVSRLLVPITVVDNRKPESDRSVLLELSDGNGITLSSTQVTIQNDDVGLEIVERDGRNLRLRAIGGTLPAVTLWQSDNLHEWKLAPVSFASDGEIIELEMNGSSVFLRAEAYPL